jgi:uncharacterized protein (TIGR03435 family)
MRRRLLLMLLGVTSCLCPVTAQTPGPTDSKVEFDVASIKRNTSGTPGGSARSMPDGSEIMVNFTIQQFIGAAYPSQSGEYVGLPDWARIGGERYDVSVKPPAGALREQRQAMWRAFFSDRLKLVAHDETSEQPIYNLVPARTDGRLGPKLTPSTHDCIAESAAARQAGGPPPRLTTDAEFLDSCGMRVGNGRLISGGFTIQALAQQLRGLSGRVVRDRTGLTGFYVIDFTYALPTSQPGGTAAAADPNEGVSVFTALQEQLGLKLEPDKMPIQHVVVDRIERPTEN